MDVCFARNPPFFIFSFAVNIYCWAKRNFVYGDEIEAVGVVVDDESDKVEKQLLGCTIATKMDACRGWKKK